MSDGYKNDGYKQNTVNIGASTEWKFSKSVAEFKNESGLTFSDISSEKYRSYEFSNGKIIRIDEPLKLNVSPSGGHRVFDSEGVSHYIPKGWVHLQWKAKDGSPHFVK